MTTSSPRPLPRLRTRVQLALSMAVLLCMLGGGFAIVLWVALTGQASGRIPSTEFAWFLVAIGVGASFLLIGVAFNVAGAFGVGAFVEVRNTGDGHELVFWMRDTWARRTRMLVADGHVDLGIYDNGRSRWIDRGRMVRFSSAGDSVVVATLIEAIDLPEFLESELASAGVVAHVTVPG